MKITRLRITNYRGVRAMDEKIPPQGAVFKGANGKGKTSVLRAIRAALAAQDIAPDAIAIGEERAEIVVDLDDVTVQRTIGKSSNVKVSRGGMFAAKPQTFLNELLGNAAIDPLDLFLKKDKERRAVVLEALPVTVTREQLREWAPVGDDVDVSGHGLEVLERVRKHFYDARTVANKAKDDAKREHERLAKALEELPVTEGLDEGAAQAELDAARAEAAGLHQREVDAKATESRQATARQRLEELRTSAAAARAQAQELHKPEEGSRLRADCDAKKAEIEQLSRKLVELRKEHAVLCDGLDAIVTRNDRAASMLADAETKEKTAAELAETLNASVAHVTEQDVARVQARVESASGALVQARTRRARVDVASKAQAAYQVRVDMAYKADELNAVVDRLTNEAPLAIAKGSNAIPGLVLEGDKLFIDGVDIDKVSGAEQMKFAVTVAKRLNAKSRILVVDGLERLDEQSMRTFIRLATDDDFQLIATRVASGEVVLEALSLDDEPKSGRRAAAP